MTEQEKVWYLDIKGEPKGPFSEAQIKRGLEQKKITQETLIFGPGMSKWDPIAWVRRFSPQNFNHAKRAGLPKPTFHQHALAHEIDFQILGEEMQYVEIELDPGEAAVAEAGSMMYMTQGIEMETIFGDGTAKQGMVEHLVGAGKRLISGESLFMTVFTNQGQGKQQVAFASPYPGKIIPMNLAEMGGELVCQKDAFLCAAKGVTVDIAFQRKIGVALFGGEGFIMQRLSGDGLAFVHAGGAIVSRTLEAGESLRVDTGCLVALEAEVSYDIEYVGSVKSAVFGGESFFFARLTGPGTVWLQSVPFSRLAGRIHEAAPQTGSGSVGEGSLLGGLSKLFER